MPTTVSTGAAGTLNPTRQQLDELEALLKRMLELPVNKADDMDETEDEDSPDEAPAAPTPVSIRTEEAPATEMRPAVSYMVVETASPRPLPPASGFEPRPTGLMPRLMPLTPPEPPEEEPAPPATEEATAEEPVAQAPAEAAPEGGAEVWVPLRSTWKPSAQTWQPLAESWQQANAAPAPAPLPVPGLRLDSPSPSEIVPPSLPEEVAQALRSLPSMIGEMPAPPASMTGETPAPPTPTTGETVAPPAEPRLRLSADDAPTPVPRVLLPLVWFNQGFDACLTPLGATGRRLSGPGGRRFLGIVGLLSLAAAVAVVASAGMGWTW